VTRPARSNGSTVNYYQYRAEKRCRSKNSIECRGTKFGVK
jgi:hypothetical protein